MELGVAVRPSCRVHVGHLFPSPASYKGYLFPLLMKTSSLVYSRKPFRSTRISGARASSVKNDPSLVLKTKGVEASDGLKGTSLFLVGMNSTIKTNLGKILAEELRYYYFDSDGLVEQALGGELVARSLREQDETGYRESETEVLKQLSSMVRLVVCAGDGAVQSSDNLALLRYGVSIWVDVPLILLAKEIIGMGNQCPSTWGISASDSYTEVLEKLAKSYEEMKEGYATADVKVSVQRVATCLGCEKLDDVTPQDMALEVLNEVEKLTRVKKMMEAAGRPF